MGRKQRRTLDGRSFKQLESARQSHEEGVVPDADCSTGKIPYRSRKAADRKMIKLRQSPRYVAQGAPLHTYQCPICYHWHVGHDTRNYRNRQG